ncbi:PREDICTED: WAT1-related protein At1g68170-like isoform X1 [Nicotiana attenuata]|uniref:WAT1-related protein n=1 Tax=Nicotiana attenuata TaxID=49451 RepID=A0A314KS87_NICAT|nr:PREDICTED: WAT1-related protein At1g68170-like isoform X1 [Nicotiana attenuata]OIT32182.1 wat1-related protein [Nicotiana attenuata]
MENYTGFQRVKHVGAMTLAAVLLGGNIILSKVAADDGMTMRVMVAYRWIFATAFLAPIAIVVEWNKRPKLTWTVILQAFLSGLLGGSLFSILFYTSVILTSATFATAIYNLIPAMTFVIAVLLRFENLSFEKASGKAKVMGTMICIGGAMVLTLYKGIEVHMWPIKIDLLHHSNEAMSHKKLPATFALGIVLAITSCICYSLWIVLLAKVSKNYPCHYSSTALMSLMGSIQSVIFALCFDRESAQWKLGWNRRLFVVVYLGTLGSGIVVILMTWCSHKRGPLFVSVFNPLILLFVALASSLLLHETLYLGSVLGGFLIIMGLYVVLWGKGKDMKASKFILSKEASQKNDLEAPQDQGGQLTGSSATIKQGMPQ